MRVVAAATCIGLAARGQLLFEFADPKTEAESHGVAGASAQDSFLGMLFGNSGKDGCEPDIHSCITDGAYAEKCPLECDFFVAVAEAVAQPDPDAALLSLLFSDRVKSALTNSSGIEVPGTLWQALEETSWSICGPCPHISCCVGYPLTVLEALSGFILPSHDEPTKDMFKELARQALMDLNPFHHDDAKEYYTSTIKFYGEQSNRLDLGWINEFLGTIRTYATKGGVHSYRKAPMTDGGVDVDFSVDALPKPEGRPLVVGVLADWGCANEGARRVMEDLKKQNPDIVIHLGDTYYAGTKEEQMEIFLNLAQEILGKDVPLLNIPGNHDYYDGGDGFLGIIDHLAETQSPKQDASFFALRGDAWQIIALDTALLDSFQLQGISAAIPLGKSWKRKNSNTMPFLPDDQLEWALKQLEIGNSRGLKTILMSHHQLFSRHESVGYANSKARERAFSHDLRAGTYETSNWAKTQEDLPGHLSADQMPSANVRLLDQFPPEALGNVSAWFWGHEHASSLFQPYAGLQRGRLIGNACIPTPKPPLLDQYDFNEKTVGVAEWGGSHPEVLEGSQVGYGEKFWNLGFVTLEVAGTSAKARYFQLEDYMQDGTTHFKDAQQYYEEDL